MVYRNTLYLNVAAKRLFKVMWNPIVYINFVYLFKVVSFRRSLKISLLYTTNIKNNSFALHLRLLLYFELKPHDLRVWPVN